MKSGRPRVKIVKTIPAARKAKPQTKISILLLKVKDLLHDTE
jgi:hypothetical protein